MGVTKRMTLKRDNEGRSKEGGQVQETSKRGSHGGDRLMDILGKTAPDRVLKATERNSKHPVQGCAGLMVGARDTKGYLLLTGVLQLAKIQLMRVDKVAGRRLAPSPLLI